MYMYIIYLDIFNTIEHIFHGDGDIVILLSSMGNPVENWACSYANHPLGSAVKWSL